MIRTWFLVGMALWAVGKLHSQSVCPGQHAGKFQLVTQPPVQAEAFDLCRVRLLDSPFKENMRRESEWILSLDVNRLLHSFRTQAGVWSGKEGGYRTVRKLGGWESLDCELRGHTIGHILSGLALLYAQTGEEQYKIKADSLVTGLAEVQQAIGTGYLSAYSEGLIDRNIRGEGVWAPWYTLHKIFSGLIDQYLYCGNSQALRIACGMADWAWRKLSPLSEETRVRMIRNEFGGVNDSFYNLYALTNYENYKKLAEFFYHTEVMQPLADRNTDLNRKHANTFIPKLIGEARNYEITGNERGRRLAEFFWNTVIDHQTFATGSNSDKEKFVETDSLSKHLTGYTGESCNVYNMLKLTRHLFCWQADPRYMDYYERALYNHILGQQDPATGMISYFLPMKAGAHKVYSTPDHSFWCCVGSGFENQAKYGESVYFHNDKGLFVNLYMPTTLDWKERGLKVTQETKFPAEDRTRLTLSMLNPQQMTVYLRYPSWSGKAEVTVNGKKVSVKQKPGSYIAIERMWTDGDCIEARFPMSLHLQATNDNPDVAAILYGPIVLAGRMGTEGMTDGAPYSDPHKYNDYYTYEYHIPAGLKDTLRLDRKHLNKSIIPVAGADGLSFEVEGIRLEPLYRIHRERYVVYWKL